MEDESQAGLKILLEFGMKITFLDEKNNYTNPVLDFPLRYCFTEDLPSKEYHVIEKSYSAER